MPSPFRARCWLLPLLAVVIAGAAPQAVGQVRAQGLTPYVLVDHKGDGQFARQDNLDSGLRVPQWVLLEF